MKSKADGVERKAAVCWGMMMMRRRNSAADLSQ
jgi:hypothetical protein